MLAWWILLASRFYVTILLVNHILKCSSAWLCDSEWVETEFQFRYLDISFADPFAKCYHEKLSFYKVLDAKEKSKKVKYQVFQNNVLGPFIIICIGAGLRYIAEIWVRYARSFWECRERDLSVFIFLKCFSECFMEGFCR